MRMVCYENSVRIVQLNKRFIFTKPRRRVAITPASCSADTGFKYRLDFFVVLPSPSRQVSG
jgi:hypothetical protein